MLETLAKQGFCLALATGKPHEYARRIVSHFGLDASLSAVFGAEFDGTRGDKAELLAYAAAALSVAPSDCVMVGDRRYDIEGALSVGATPIGVLFGYGDREELAAAGCRLYADSPADVARIVLDLAK